MSESRDIRICVAAPTDPSKVETFVRAHIRRLPGSREVLYGRPFAFDQDGRPVGPSAAARTVGAIARRVFRLPAGRRLENRALSRHLKRRGVDVVLAEFGQAGAMLRAACLRAGVPLVVQFHGTDAYTRVTLERWGAAYRRLFADCSAVVAVSGAMGGQLISLGAPPEKVHVISSGVDCVRFSPTDPGANPPLFLAVGRFVEKKAPHLTLLAFRRVLEACPEARLKMIGDGPLLPMCRDMVAALGLAGAAELPGRQSHEEVAAALARGRAFVQHSLTASDGNSEGTPVAVLEAGATALPVVSTRHAGIPEAVVEGKTGLLVDEQDVRGMAEHMVTLARDREMARRLGSAARERIAAEYSMERSIGALYELLSNVARNPGRQRGG